MEERRQRGPDRRTGSSNRRTGIDRRLAGIAQNGDMAGVSLDSPELSRLAAEVARRQNRPATKVAQVQTAPAQRARESLKNNLPYAALIAAALFAAYGIYQSHLAPPQALPVAVAVPAPAPVQPPVSDEAKKAAVLPDKLRQISSCQAESMKVYPEQGDVRALQYYNLCMTGAGFTPDYSCDTSVGLPAYNPECWTPGKNL